MIELDDNETLLAKIRECQMMFPMITKIWHQIMQQHLNEHAGGISVLQYGVLRTLDAEPLTLNELSRRFQLDPSTLVRTLHTLVKRRLVTRSRDPNDRRRKPLRLSDRGAELLASLPMMSDSDELANGMRQMGEAKVEQLQALLREMILNLPDGQTTLQELAKRLSDHSERIRKC